MLSVRVDYVLSSLQVPERGRAQSRQYRSGQLRQPFAPEPGVRPRGELLGRRDALLCWANPEDDLSSTESVPLPSSRGFLLTSALVASSKFLDHTIHR
jgi:hypothetical protein